MKPIFSEKQILDAVLYRKVVEVDVSDPPAKIRLRISPEDYGRGQASLRVLRGVATNSLQSPCLFCAFSDINIVAHAMVGVNWGTIERRLR